MIMSPPCPPSLRYSCPVGQSFYDAAEDKTLDTMTLRCEWSEKWNDTENMELLPCKREK